MNNREGLSVGTILGWDHDSGPTRYWALPRALRLLRARRDTDAQADHHAPPSPPNAVPCLWLSSPAGRLAVHSTR